MLAYTGTRISPNIIRDNAGFLICTAPICRSGWQEYRRSELEPASNDDTLVRAYRPASEVTSSATVASGEGKPIVSPHPARFVTPDSWSWTARGHIQNVRVGANDKNGNVQLFADIHVQDAGLIDKISAGVRDLSCGYTYDAELQADGTYVMRNIRLNHVAIVESGRAGTSKIMDSRSIMTDEERNQKLDRICDLLEGLIVQRNCDAQVEEESARLFAQDGTRRDPPDFFSMARQFHRRNVQDVQPEEESARAAQDAANNGEVDFFVAARRLHRLSPSETRAEIERICRPSLLRGR